MYQQDEPLVDLKPMDMQVNDQIPSISHCEIFLQLSDVPVAMGPDLIYVEQDEDLSQPLKEMSTSSVATDCQGNLDLDLATNEDQNWSKHVLH